MLHSHPLARAGAGSSSRSSSTTAARPQRRACICGAQRGRPRKTAGGDAAAAPAPEPAAAPAVTKRKGRPRKQTDAEPEPWAAPAPPAVQVQAAVEHERVVSMEMDITSSMELDYTDNTALIVPSYTHQAQGHESATQPPLDNFVPDFDGAGFVGEEPPQQEQQPQSLQRQPQSHQQQQLVQQAGLLQQVQALQGRKQQARQQQEPQPQPQAVQPQPYGGVGLQVMSQPQLMGPAAESTDEEAGGDEEEDEFAGIEEPPGLFDYEAGLAFAVTQPEPERRLSALPAAALPRNRREADYMLRYINWLGTMERLRRQEEYEERALSYHLAARKESENVYLTGKAMSVVMAEIELEDVQSGNRVDNMYPIWARAEHRWYPSGRFAAYNAYVKDNLPELVIKAAPGADQEEDFDIMDDVLLMTDDPSMQGGGDGDEDDTAGGPAAGLSLEAFMGAGLLPGAASSELGQAYIEDVLAPGGAEEEELVMDEE